MKDLIGIVLRGVPDASLRRLKEGQGFLSPPLEKAFHPP